MNKLTTQTAILIGCLMISISILVAGGVIKPRNTNTEAKGAAALAANPSQPSQPSQPQAKTEADIVVSLKSLAGKLNLDQSKFNKCLDSGEKTIIVSNDLNDGSNAGVQGTPSFFINGTPFLKGAAPFAEFKKAIDVELSGTASAAEKKQIGNGNLPALGNVNAPVALVEFSDYQCPFCARFYKDAEAQIKKEYVDSGKVKIYFRDFPLTQIHPGAQKASEAARCAGDQGKYWEFHDQIFENQQSIF